MKNIFFYKKKNRTKDDVSLYDMTAILNIYHCAREIRFYFFLSNNQEMKEKEKKLCVCDNKSSYIVIKYFNCL